MSPSEMEKLDSSCEPMDVDLSIHSAGTSEVAQNDLEYTEDLVRSPSKVANTPPVSPEAWTIKTYHINMKTEKKSRSLIKPIVAFLIICVSIIIYLGLDLKCTDELNMTELRSSLLNRVHDQTDAIETFIQALSLNDESKILFVYGSTGVGKTYTTSVLLENIWNSSNIYHFTMPSFLDRFSIDTMYGINICKTSIVIVDDLKPSDLLTVKEIILEIFKKTEKLKKKSTIILNINCDIITKELAKKCDNEFYEELTKSFMDVHVTKKFIRYKPLTQKTLEKCVKDVLGRQIISNQEIKNFLNNFDVTLDGCKGVYKKVQFLENMRYDLK